MLNAASKVAIGLVIPVGIYAVVLGTLMTPYFQRFALYAHKFNTLFLHDINNAEQFGFAKGQVTPFNIRTPDGETLYAWHVLPLDVYARHEKALQDAAAPDGPVDDFESTKAFKLLAGPKNSRVVISFHGNAGHIAQGWRTDTFRYLALQPNTHVITVDYRGFGHSTGSPTEIGLITDGVALVNWVIKVAKIQPEQIVILGQSLGTAVASAVSLYFVDPTSTLLPQLPELTENERQPLLANNTNPFGLQQRETVFKGVVLVAPFANLPSLLLTYRLSGVVPLLAPLRPFPWITKPVLSRMVDKWPTADRLAAYYRTLSKSESMIGDRQVGSLQVLHATSDMDISWRQTAMIAEQVLGNESARIIDAADDPVLVDVRAPDKPAVRFEIGQYGAHNRIVTYAPVSLAVMRAFEGIATGSEV